MEKLGNAETKAGFHAKKLLNPQLTNLLQDPVKFYEAEKQILLDLSKALTQVRVRDDLVTLFSSGIKSLFHYTYAVITLIDDQKEACVPFLCIEHPPIVTPLQLNDPIIRQIVDADGPVLFTSLDGMRRSSHSFFLKENHGIGIKELLVTPLRHKDQPIGFLYFASNASGGFTVALKHIIKALTPLFSAAVSNIIRNEEAKQKEWDKSFLLNFSGGIAAVRTKDDLADVVYNSLKKLSQVNAYFIRTLNEDGVTLSPFLHDKDAFYIESPLFKTLLGKKITITDGITGRVMGGNVPVVIDFAEEVNRGTVDPYVEFWKKVGYKKAGFEQMVGTPLRVGEKELGVLWVITNRINAALLEGICAQLSIAISNILANEEIARREEEKSKLLSLSDGIAAMRNRNDLLRVVSAKLKMLFSIDEFGISQVDEGGTTYSAFVMDLGGTIESDAQFEQVTGAKYVVNDPVFSALIQSEDPILFDVAKLVDNPDVPAYVDFWKRVGLRYVLGMALRVGGTTVGSAFFHIDPNEALMGKNNLIRAICSQLAVAVSNILANEQLIHYKQMLEIENDHLKEQIKTIYNFSEIIGNGEEMRQVYHLMSLVAATNSTVLLLGETGTGKELIARAIHNASPRKDKLMIKVNCAALPANLIESELFGHERGAFTGAVDRRLGKFELAHNGTLFLDEIGEMPLETQVKLLRVLQEREFERVGGKNPIKVNVRIIAATNRKLDEEVSAGRFRPDLYYRLNVFPIILPPLRNRWQDIEPLAQFFVARYSRSSGRKVTAISPQVVEELKRYPWPGNVRELEHLIERSVLLAEGNILKEVQLPTIDEPDRSETDIFPKALQEIEASYIIQVLKRCNGKISGAGGAADILGIPATTLHSKMKKLGVSKANYF